MADEEKMKDNCMKMVAELAGMYLCTEVMQDRCEDRSWFNGSAVFSVCQE